MRVSAFLSNIYKKSQILKFNSLIQHVKPVVELEIYLGVSSPWEEKGLSSPVWTRNSGKMTQGEKVQVV